MSRRVEAIALGVSGALHGVVLCAGLAAGWPHHVQAVSVPIELVVVEPAPAAPAPEPVRPSPPVRPIDRPAFPQKLPPPQEPAVTTREPERPPTVSAPPPVVTAPDPPPRAVAEPPRPVAEPTPPPDAAVAAAHESSVRSNGSTAASAPATTATSSSGIAAGALSREGSPTGARDASPPASGPSVAAVPPSASIGPVTQRARPRGGYQVRPAYPADARRAQAEGTTTVRAHITTDGTIDEIQVQSSAGHPALDQAAVAAVRKWRFEPARSGTVAVAAWVVIPVEFRLRDE